MLTKGIPLPWRTRWDNDWSLCSALHSNSAWDCLTFCGGNLGWRGLFRCHKFFVLRALSSPNTPWTSCGKMLRSRLVSGQIVARESRVLLRVSFTYQQTIFTFSASLSPLTECCCCWLCAVWFADALNIDDIVCWYLSAHFTWSGFTVCRHGECFRNSFW